MCSMNGPFYNIVRAIKDSHDLQHLSKIGSARLAYREVITSVGGKTHDS